MIGTFYMDSYTLSLVLSTWKTLLTLKNIYVSVKLLLLFFFRVMLGAFPLIIPNDPIMKMKIEEKAWNLLKKDEWIKKAVQNTNKYMKILLELFS